MARAVEPSAPSPVARSSSPIPVELRRDRLATSQHESIRHCVVRLGRLGYVEVDHADRHVLEKRKSGTAWSDETLALQLEQRDLGARPGLGQPEPGFETDSGKDDVKSPVARHGMPGPPRRTWRRVAPLRGVRRGDERAGRGRGTLPDS